MHTEAQTYFSPSSQTSLIWAQVDSYLSRVWSQWARMFFTSIRLLPFYASCSYFTSTSS